MEVYELTAWKGDRFELKLILQSRLLHEKQIVTQLVKAETERFIIMFTRNV
jgi:hypothetical protein